MYLLGSRIGFQWDVSFGAQAGSHRRRHGSPGVLPATFPCVGDCRQCFGNSVEPVLCEARIYHQNSQGKVIIITVHAPGLTQNDFRELPC